MATRVRVTLAAACIAAAACAKAGGGQPGGSGSGAGGPSTDAVSQVSTQVSTAASGTSGSGGAASSTTTTNATASSTGSGPMCSESPCKLTVPQCGCPSGKECTVDPTGRKCVTAGSATLGQKCDNANLCAPGLLCGGISPTVSVCDNFCSSDNECKAPGGICVLTLDDGKGGAIPNVTLCSENCDPATATGCPATTGCQLFQEQSGQMRIFSRCTGTGAGVKGSLCKTPADCAVDFGCIGQDAAKNSVCLKWCKVASPTCGPGEMCSPFQTPAKLGAVEYGACI